MSSVVVGTDAVSPEKLDDNIKLIARKFNYQLKPKVLSDVNNNLVIPIYNVDKIKLPKFIPGFLWGGSGHPVAIMNLGEVATQSKDGFLNIDNRTLYAYLQTGTIMLACHNNWNKVSMNPGITRYASLCYAKLFGRVLDKMFAINLDGQRSDMARYCIAKFFLMFQLDRPANDMTTAIACLSTYNNTTKNTLTDCDSHFSEDAYDSFDKFIDALKTLPGLQTLTFRGFINEWMNMYDPSSVLALEYFPFLCHMVFSAMVLARINKEAAIENTVASEMTDLYNEMARIFR
jgi:hypothetical protein